MRSKSRDAGICLFVTLTHLWWYFVRVASDLHEKKEVELLDVVLAWCLIDCSTNQTAWNENLIVCVLTLFLSVKRFGMTQSFKIHCTCPRLIEFTYSFGWLTTFHSYRFGNTNVPKINAKYIFAQRMNGRTTYTKQMAGINTNEKHIEARTIE